MPGTLSRISNVARRQSMCSRSRYATATRVISAMVRFTATTSASGNPISSSSGAHTRPVPKPVAPPSSAATSTAPAPNITPVVTYRPSDTQPPVDRLEVPRGRLLHIAVRRVPVAVHRHEQRTQTLEPELPQAFRHQVLPHHLLDL